MALRIVIVLCLLCAALRAVDECIPGLVPHFDAAFGVAAFDSSPAMASALEEKRNEDAEDTEHEGTYAGETCSTTQHHSECNGDAEVKTPEHGDSFAARVWSRTKLLLSKHMLEVLVPREVQSLLRNAWGAVQDVQPLSHIGINKTGLLVVSISCFLIAAIRRKRGTKNSASKVKTSPPILIHPFPINCTPNLIVPEMHHQNIFSGAHNGRCNYMKRKKLVQWSRKGAAATVIQRWVRCEFKQWLQASKYQSSIAEPSLNSQMCVEGGHDADVRTSLEDAPARAEKPHSKGDKLCSGDGLPLEKRFSEIKLVGSDDA